MYFEETGAYDKPTNRTILEKLTNSFSDYWFCFIHLFCPLLLGNQHKDYAPPFLTQKYSSFSIHLTDVLFRVLISLAWTTVFQWSTFLSALPPPCLFMHMCVCVRMRTHVHTHTQSLSFVWFCNPMDYSLPGSSVFGISQARILEWVAFSLPGDLPHPGIKPTSPVSPVLAGRFFTTELPGKLCYTVGSY